MQINNTMTQGLKHQFQVTIPFKTIDERVKFWLEDKSKNVRLDGFRPGKTPLNILRQRYGGQALQETISQLTQEATQKIYKDNNLRAAGQPNYHLNPIEEGKDFSFSLDVEVLPEIHLKDFAKIKLEKLEVKVTDKEVEESLKKLAERYQKFNPAPEKHKASKGDQVTVNLIATIHHKKIKSYSGNGVKLVIGSDQPDFEFLAQTLIGHKKGEKLTTENTFASDFSDAQVAGKTVVFEIEIISIAQPQSMSINDEFAKEFDCENLAALREKITASLKADYNKLARLYHKRYLLDALAADYNFDLPSQMVKHEFDSIWNRLQEEIKAARESGELDPTEANKPLSDYEKEYKEISERRVRLGLLVAEVAKQHNIRVTPEMVRDLIFREAMRYPGQEKQVVSFYRNHPEYVEQLTGPALEDLVVDFILSKITLKDINISFEELQKRLKGILPQYDTDDNDEEKPAKTSKPKKPKKKVEDETL